MRQCYSIRCMRDSDGIEDDIVPPAIVDNATDTVLLDRPVQVVSP